MQEAKQKPNEKPLLYTFLSGAYERWSREGACNYRVHPSAIQIQIISERTSK